MTNKRTHFWEKYDDLSLASKCSSVFEKHFFSGAKALSPEHSFYVFKQVVVVGSQIRTIQWVEKQFQPQFAEFAIVANKRVQHLR